MSNVAYFNHKISIYNLSAENPYKKKYLNTFLGLKLKFYEQNR